MELIKKEELKLIMSQYVGEAKETLESGEEKIYELSITMNGAPIINFPNGDKVVFSWEDIIKIAKDYKDKK